MKCVKFYRPHGGQVVRVTDEEAHQIVSQKKGIYAPKHWWKAANAKEA